MGPIQAPMIRPQRERVIQGDYAILLVLPCELWSTASDYLSPRTAWRRLR
jgi:hypothetical protein